MGTDWAPREGFPPVPEDVAAEMTSVPAPVQKDRGGRGGSPVKKGSKGRKQNHFLCPKESRMLRGSERKQQTRGGREKERTESNPVAGGTKRLVLERDPGGKKGFSPRTSGVKRRKAFLGGGGREKSPGAAKFVGKKTWRNPDKRRGKQNEFLIG